MNVRQFHKFSSKYINQNKQAFIMFSFSKTSEWLDTLQDHEKNKMINEGSSISEGKWLLTQFKDRCNDIVKKRRQILKEKKNALAKKKQSLLAQWKKQSS